MISASTLAGIGFTISLFITGRAFSDPVLLTSAKVGIIIASVLAGVIGWVALNQISPHYDRSTSVDAELLQIT